jgi:hypothetical protein
MGIALDRVQTEADTSTSVILFDNGFTPDQSNPAWPYIILNIPAGTTAHSAYQQAILFCAQHGVRVIPQFVIINPSGTTGTVIQ